MSLSPAVQSAIYNNASAYGADPRVISGIAITESGGNQNAVGAAGEIGVMQLMAGTAAQMGVDPTDLNQNVAGGTAYYASLLNQFGDTNQAIVAYNAGPTTVANAIATYGSNWTAGVPASSLNYLNNVLANGGIAGTSSAPGGISTPAPTDTSELYTEPSANGSSGVSSFFSSLSTVDIVAAAGALAMVVWYLV